ncbi:uncharacterized protein N7496_008443 [Penicillium cataractarum]|uniref:Uncharacterized protein n=1 Tax=Penicillium cataractarum TaxID=2100454 RepID=A0A9W9S324_9EURO|nr:uncharacterized protein N7496_008443 [Penicillium cataractarum]KAJ5368683.1 hypothetical protein N7496_008443 [Penicillium cataractarum]
MAFINQRTLHLAAIMLLTITTTLAFALAMPVATRACLDLGPVTGHSFLTPARLQVGQGNPYGGSDDPQSKAARDHGSLIVIVMISVFLAAVVFFLVSKRLGLMEVYGAWCRGWRDNLRQLNPKNIWDKWCAFWKDRTRQYRHRREGFELQPYPGPPPSAPYQRLPSPARPAPALIRLGRFQVGRGVLGAGQ